MSEKESVYVFKGNTHHDKGKYQKGEACPSGILAEMKKKELVCPLPEAVKPVAPAPASQMPPQSAAQSKNPSAKE